jgi:hypothetical protein
VADTDLADTGLPDTDLADTGLPDTDLADTEAPDTDLADTGLPDTDLADTEAPDTDTTDVLPDSEPTDTDLADTEAPDTVPADTGVPDTMADTSIDTVPDADTTDTGVDVCGADPSFTGQVGAIDPPGGGVAVFVTRRNEAGYPDANLDAVQAVLPLVDPASPVELAVPVDVFSATVVATSYRNTSAVPPSQSNFWVADANQTIEVRLDYTSAANVPPFEVRVGQQISFSVLAVDAYFGAGQIQAASNWQLDADTVPVYVLERTYTPVTLDDVGELVRVEGRISGGGAACGGASRCWDLSYAGGSLLTLRSASTLLAPGQCVSFVGVLSSFGGVAQANSPNFDWTSIR